MLLMLLGLVWMFEIAPEFNSRERRLADEEISERGVVRKVRGERVELERRTSGAFIQHERIFAPDEQRQIAKGGHVPQRTRDIFRVPKQVCEERTNAYGEVG